MGDNYFDIPEGPRTGPKTRGKRRLILILSVAVQKHLSICVSIRGSVGGGGGLEAEGLL